MKHKIFSLVGKVWPNFVNNVFD